MENDEDTPHEEEDEHNKSGLPSHLLKGLLEYGLRKEIEENNRSEEEEYGQEDEETRANGMMLNANG